MIDSSLRAVSCSRALIEHELYSRLRRHPRVNFLQRCAVTEICTNPDRTHAIGVRFQSRAQPQTSPEQINADLIVDASGRNSPMPQWLQRLGYTPPDEITVDAKAGYASRLYRRTEFGPDWKLMYYLAEAPMQSRGGIILPIEGTAKDANRWLVTLVGLNGDHPPTDEAGFLDFARSLPAPELYAALTHAKPLGAPYGYRQAANRLRQYDQLPRYLEGLLAIGDAVYALNPVYGQGMTVAALGAKTLQALLQEEKQRHGLCNIDGVARKFQRKLAKVIDGPWQLATGQDLRWPVAASHHKPSLIEQLMQRYFGAVIRTMAEDETVAEAFFFVQNMLKSPVTLFHPFIVNRVLRAQFKQKKYSDVGRSVSLSRAA